MEFASFRKTLAFATENLGNEIFESEQFNKIVAQSLDETGKWHRRKCVLIAPFVVRFVLLMILYRSLSIANIVRKVLFQFRHWFPQLPLISITSEAFCHARKRLGADVLRLIFEKQTDSIKLSPSFHDLTIVGVDGTKLRIPDTPENEERFGRPTNSRDTASYPRMEVVTLVDAFSRQLLGVNLMRCHSSEREGLMEIFDKIPKSALVLMDRGISALWLMEKLLNDSKHFLARITVSWNPTIISSLGKGDYLVRIQGRIRNTNVTDKNKTGTLMLRMVKYQVKNGETVRLLTDLLDHVKYPAKEIVMLYHQRWECEIAYDEFKTHLSTTAGGAQDLIFRSKKPDGVIQEVYALFVLYNIIRGFMSDAGELCKVNPLHISFVDSVQIIRETASHFFTLRQESKKFVLTSRMLRDISDTVNPRPRRKRSYPRVVKHKMSDYYRKRPGCHGRFRDFKSEVRLLD